MRILKSIAEMQFYSKKMHEGKKSLGFVPTMGYFHDGHISLMKEAHIKNDISVVSIFVNPTQFGKNEDFNTYPKDMEHDSRIAMEIGIDILFTPDCEEIYLPDFSTEVIPGEIGNILCGASRPGHFIGVSTVVTKLFNIIRPQNAYFGQKDFQQSFIVKKIIRDLNMDVEIVVLPTVREKDGLAMSSRNVYLSQVERKNAAILFESLNEANKIIQSGERDSKKIISVMREMIEKTKDTHIDYIAIVDKNTLQNKLILEGTQVIVLSVFIGKTRLIDNMEISL